MLFSVFINDIFLFVRWTNICNYADDTTILSCHTALETIVRQLETDGTLLAKCFSNNYLKLNDDKLHLMIFGDMCTLGAVAIRNSTVNQIDYEKLVGIAFDKKLSFRNHIEDLCKKANNAPRTCSLVHPYRSYKTGNCKELFH